ncbi:MAG: PAS domain S-box protein [Anaerotignum sp.]|nr:PAS domain S-box protein [Anaerotignum sp.]
MTQRIFRSIFLVALAVMLSVSALIMGMMYRYTSMETRKELSREAEYIALGIQNEGTAYFDYLDKVHLTDSRVTWIAPDGDVLFDSVMEEGEMENHADREEVREAFRDGHGEGERFSSTLSEKTWYCAVRLEDGSVVRLSIETASILTVFFTMTYPLVLILVAIGCVSLFLAFQTAKLITNPINEIDLEHPENAVVYDELSPLLRKIAVQNREIHRQMAELKRRKEEFDTITANMQEGLLVLDAEGAVLSSNEGVLRLLGLSHVEEGQNVFQLNRSETFRRGVEAALKGEHREEKLELGGRVYELFANPVFRDGENAGVILVLFDATEKEGREKLRREFTANVSHELKTPLTSISGFAEIMKSGMVRPEDMGNFAGKIYDEAQRLIALIQDIIKLSKLDEKESFLEKEWVELDAIVLEVRERLQPTAEKKNIRLMVHAEPLQVFGVRPVLMEMVYNLCDNAIRYNKTDGEVRMTLREEKGNAILEVADTGIGIAKEEQERIFERFYRVDASRSAENGGTGLGLSIVKHGAALHHGKISLVSVPGKGTTMKISIPLKE